MIAVQAFLPWPEIAEVVADQEAFTGPEYAKWYASTGAQGMKPDDPHLLKIFDLFRGAASQKAPERIETAKEIWRIPIDP